MKKTKTIAGLVLAVGVATVAASSVAGPVTTTPQSAFFSLTMSEIKFLGPKSNSGIRTFNEFDPGLGTLQQVVFRWQSQLTVDATFDDTEPQSIEATADAALTGLGTLFSNTFSATAPAGALSANISEAVTGSRTYSTAGDLAYFIGTGTFDAQLNLGVKVTTDNASDNMVANWGTSANPGRLSVEYVYEARTTGQLPEPGALLLGAAAAVAAGLSARRRRKTRH